jgi:hypothetical protein
VQDCGVGFGLLCRRGDRAGSESDGQNRKFHRARRILQTHGREVAYFIAHCSSADGPYSAGTGISFNRR